MNTKTFLSTTLAATVSALALVVTAPVMAAPDGMKPVHSTPAQAQTATHQGDAFYFPEPVGPAKTRAQVVAETLEAIRVGAISNGERYEFPTQQQLESIRLAGVRAQDATVAAGAVKSSAN